MSFKPNHEQSRAALPKIAALEQLRDSRHICFAENIRSASRAVTRRYARHLGPNGVTGAQGSILTRLYYIGAVSVARLACEMETERTTMVRNVALLEKSGHVVVEPARKGRSRLVRLTDKGLGALEQLMPRWQQAQDQLRAELGPEDWDVMMRGLRRLVELEALASSSDVKPRGGGAANST